MPVYDLQHLETALQQAGIPLVDISKIEFYLNNNGYFGPGPTPETQPPFIDYETTISSNANIEVLKGATSYTLDTSTFNNGPGNLDYIVFGSHNETITVNGPAENYGASLIGHDDLIINDGGNHSVWTDGGHNTVDASGSSGYNILESLNGADTLIGGAGGGMITADNGTTGGQLISNSDASHFTVVTDYAGNHLLQGGLGGDVLQAFGTGDDTLKSGGGDTFMQTGGSGSNTLDGSASGHDTIESGSTGSNNLLIGGNGDSLFAFSSDGGGKLISQSTVGGFAFLDNTGSTADHTLQGGAGNDVIYTSGAHDTLKAGTGDQLLQTFGSGSNKLVGGIGSDTLIAGSSGSDTLIGGSGSNTLIAQATSGGGRLISGSLAGGGNTLIDESNNAHTLIGGDGNDVLFGGNGGDVLRSSSDTLTSGSSLLVGGTGDDRIFAVGSGSNTLIGGAGDDLMDASQASGHNVFTVGLGNDTVIGGSGFDFFHDETNLNDPNSNVTVQITGGPEDVLSFDNRTQGDLLAGPAGDSTSGGIRTLTFQDGKVYEITSSIVVEFKP